MPQDSEFGESFSGDENTDTSEVEPLFLGDDRKDLVFELLAEFDKCKETFVPCWVSLEGVPGSGKTRIIQDFYHQMALSRNDSGYWPPSIFTGIEPHLSPMSLRHVVSPKWLGSPGTLPDYLWWGVECSHTRGHPVSALLTALLQFEEHKLPIEEAWAHRAPLKDKMLTFFKRTGTAATEEGVTEAATVTAGEIASLLTEEAVSSILGIGALIRGVKAVSRHQGTTNHRKLAVNTGVAIDGSSEFDPVEEALNLTIRLCTQAILPIVIFIDDFQDADQALIEYISRLLRRKNCAVMIVTTSLVDRIRVDGKFATLCSIIDHSSTHSNYRRIGVGLESGSSVTITERVDELKVGELEYLIKHYVPKVLDDVANSLATRYRQPLLLELIVSDPSLTAQFDEDLSLMDESAIQELPSSLIDYFRTSFNRLPVDARRYLEIAIQTLPQFIDLESEFRTADWCPEYVTPVYVKLYNETITDFDNFTIALAGWVERIDSRRYRFLDWVQMDAITKPRQNAIKMARISLARDVEINLAKTEIRFDTDYEERIVLAFLAIGENIDRTAICTATSHRIYRLRDLPRYASEIINLGELYFDNTDNLRSHESMIVRSNSALARVNIGDETGAVNELKQLLLLQEALYGEYHEDTLTTYANLGAVLVGGRRADEALKYLRKAMLGRKATLPNYHEDLLVSRGTYATCVGELGEIDRSLDYFNALIPDLVNSLGASHRYTIGMRAQSIVVQQRLGSTDRIVIAWRSLMEDSIAAAGDHNPDTLTIMNNLFAALVHMGQDREALEILNVVLERRRVVLGAEHPLTLITENNYIEATASIDNAKEAVDAFRSIVDRQTMVLSKDHADFWPTRHNLGLWLSLDGRPLEGIVEMEYVAQQRAAGIGICASETLRSRCYIAIMLDKAGFLGSAERVLSEVLADMRSSLDTGNSDLVDAQDWYSSIYQRIRSGEDIGDGDVLYARLVPV